jgi:hypothetical protein
MAYKSTGTLLKIGAVSIADVTSISDVGPTNEAGDSSNLSTTAKTFATLGVVDNGELAISGNFNPKRYDRTESNA